MEKAAEIEVTKQSVETVDLSKPKQGLSLIRMVELDSWLHI